MFMYLQHGIIMHSSGLCTVSCYNQLIQYVLGENSNRVFLPSKIPHLSVPPESAAFSIPPQVNKLLCGTQFFFLASATTAKAIVMNQGPKDKGCQPLVHLLFRNGA